MYVHADIGLTVYLWQKICVLFSMCECEFNSNSYLSYIGEICVDFVNISACAFFDVKSFYGNLYTLQF